MHLLWVPIVEPILTALEPRTIVEVGADEGLNTRKLLEFAKKRAETVVHVVDPAPKFDPSEWERAHGSNLIFHRSRSLDALPHISRPDVVLLDGDHNWYTVIHELRALDSSSEGDFPVVLLHDVGWPYGRRDLYYEPDSIPTEHRRPLRKGGLRPEAEEPLERGGLNPHLHHGITEGGARNGIRTAVDDFLSESDRSLVIRIVPGLHGLGILYPTNLQETNPAAAAVIDSLTESPKLHDLLRVLENLRIDATIALRDARDTVEKLKARSARLSQHLESVSAVRDDLRMRLQSLTDAQRADRNRIARLEHEIAVAHARAHAITSRRSVRVALRLASLTKPLFRLARRAFGRSNPQTDTAESP